MPDANECNPPGTLTDHKETEVPDEDQLIERYEELNRKLWRSRESIHTCEPLALLVSAEAIAKKIDRLTSKLAEAVSELKVIAKYA